MADRANAVARRRDAAIAVIDKAAEVHVVRFVIARRSRPIEAVVADIVQTAVVGAAITRSRIPDGGCRTELAGEVHAFVRTLVGVVKIR